MDKDKLELIVENEKEWRKHILTKVERIESRQLEINEKVSGLRNKFKLLTIIIGATSGSLGAYLKNKLLG